jgi:hypothetical protein
MSYIDETREFANTPTLVSDVKDALAEGGFIMSRTFQKSHVSVDLSPHAQEALQCAAALPGLLASCDRRWVVVR